jgi:hypothetical protein
MLHPSSDNHQIYTDSPFALGVADIWCIDAQHMIQIAASFYIIMGAGRFAA